jgi:hypothetical protein
MYQHTGTHINKWNLSSLCPARKIILYLPFIIFHFILFQCANPIPPQGGPRDETPPQLDTAESTRNYQTNFEKQPIVFTFDEWVELDDPYNQIVISPPVDRTEFEVSIKRKSVIFEFTEDLQLREQATYTINFGEAIKDLTEGNAADYLRFVFSTGDHLDSLTLSGTVVDAKTNEPVEEVYFMLYENLADSVVRTERPFYFGKTDETGRFQISNIKEGTFKSFAILDEGQRYIYDQNTEQIGFPDSLITLSDTAAAPEIRIRLFQERITPRILEEDLDEFGLIKLTLNKPPSGMKVTTPNGPLLVMDYDRDTLKLWYAEEQTNPWRLIVRKDTLLNDTLSVPAVAGAEFLESASLERIGGSGANIAPNDSFKLRFNHPLSVLDTARITLLEDTLRTRLSPNLVIDTFSRRQLAVRSLWQEGVQYELELLPGALYDIFGIPNADTILQQFRVRLRKDFGNLNLTVNGLDSLSNYVLQLRDGDRTVRQRIITNSQTYQERFTLLPPATYTLRIITDWNGNGRWDTGHYDTHRQPEPIFLQELEQLRANWDVEAEVALGNQAIRSLGN